MPNSPDQQEEVNKATTINRLLVKAEASLVAGDLLTMAGHFDAIAELWPEAGREFTVLADQIRDTFRKAGEGVA